MATDAEVKAYIRATLEAAAARGRPEPSAAEILDAMRKGYPPGVYRRMLADLFETTRADFTRPGPNVLLGQSPERALLQNVLPPDEELTWEDLGYAQPGLFVVGVREPHAERVAMVGQALRWNRWVEVEPQYPGGWSYVSPRGVSDRAVLVAYDPSGYFDGRENLKGIYLSVVAVDGDWTERCARAFQPRYLDRMDELGVMYFASGANSPGDLRGFLTTGHNVGATVPEFVKAKGEPLRATTWQALQALAQDPEFADRHVFLDSGAFAEVDKHLNEVKHIGDADWHYRLDQYARAARWFGPRVHVVLPDRLGWQIKTLARQRRHVDRIQQLHALGAQLLVPLPRGLPELEEPHPLADQFALSAEMLNLSPDDLVPSIPTAKFPVRPEEAAAFVQDFRDRYGFDVQRLHLLGSGPTTPFGQRKIEGYVAALRAVQPHIAVSCDSAEKRRLSNREPIYGVTKAAADDFVRVAADQGVLPWTEYTDPEYLDDWVDRPTRARMFKFLSEELGLPLTAADRLAYLEGQDPNEGWLRELQQSYLEAGHEDVSEAIEEFLADAWERRTGPRSGLVTDWVHQKAIEFTEQAIRELEPTGDVEAYRANVREFAPERPERPLRVLVVTSCTGRKVDYPAPAEELYTGRQHLALMAGVEAARERGWDVDVWVVSAGLGLVHGSYVCDPYDVTFSGKSPATIRREAQELGVPEEVAELLAADYDVAVVVLGRDYLLAADLAEVEEFGGPVVVPVAPSALELLPDDPRVLPVPLEAADVARLGGQVKAKGEWARRFLGTLELEPQP